MKYSDELLLHFTCDKCSMWWSIAISDNWNPTQDVPVGRSWFCPWCGHKHDEPHEKIQE